MTRDELIDRVATAINDDANNPTFYTSAQFNDLIDEAVELISEDGLVLNRSAVIPVRPGCTFYYLPYIDPDAMAVRRIWSQKDQIKLSATTMSELGDWQERWLETPGDPQVWFPVSWDIFGLYPAPTVGGDVLHIAYTAWPRNLLDDNDEPELPEASQEAVLMFAQYLGTLKKWDTQSASAILKQLVGHRSLSKARSGISRISARIFQRTQHPHNEFPKGDLHG